MQWRGFLDGQRRELERFAAGDARTLPTVFVPRPRRVGRRPALQLRRGGPSRHASSGCVPKEKLPTYNVFYEGRTFSRGGPGLALDADGVPLGDYLFAFRLRPTSPSRCARTCGRPTARCAAAATRARRSSSTSRRRRIAWASTPRGARCSRRARPTTRPLLLYANAVGGQDGLIFDGGGFVFQNGRLVLEAPRFTDGWWSAVVDLDRTLRLRMENTTWRSDCEAFRLQRETVPAVTSDGETADRSTLHVPGAEGGSFFLPAEPAPGARSARARARRPVRGARAGRRRATSRRPRAFTVAGHRAVGRPRLDADAARRVARGAADRGRRRDRGLLHAEPPLAGTTRSDAAHQLAASWASTLADDLRSTRPSSARSR